MDRFHAAIRKGRENLVLYHTRRLKLPKIPRQQKKAYQYRPKTLLVQPRILDQFLRPRLDHLNVFFPNGRLPAVTPAASIYFEDLSRLQSSRFKMLLALAPRMIRSDNEDSFFQTGQSQKLLDELLNTR